MADYSLVLTTAGSQDEARKIAHALVERRQAACVNILPQIESIYRWQGAVESANEWLLLIKTASENFLGVCSTVEELHSYEVPECISIKIDAGSEKYLEWLKSSMT